MEYCEFIQAAEGLLGPLGEERRERFRALEGLYREWNDKVNVISRKDIDSLYDHHVLHSLTAAAYMKRFMPEDFALAFAGKIIRGPENPGEIIRGLGEPGEIEQGPESPTEIGQGTGNFGKIGQVPGENSAPLRFLDVGTGGGFPGIPLAIAFPAAHFTLCDSIGKKVRVAADVAARLGLKNVQTVNARAESLPDTYDYVVSRAVAPLQDFLPWVRGRFRRGALCLKGGDVAQETALAAARLKLPRGSVHTWSIDNCLDDSYFHGKFVIFIENFCK